MSTKTLNSKEEFSSPTPSKGSLKNSPTPSKGSLKNSPSTSEVEVKPDPYAITYQRSIPGSIIWGVFTIIMGYRIFTVDNTLASTFSTFLTVKSICLNFVTWKDTNQLMKYMMFTIIILAPILVRDTEYWQWWLIVFTYILAVPLLFPPNHKISKIFTPFWTEATDDELRENEDQAPLGTLVKETKRSIIGTIIYLPIIAICLAIAIINWNSYNEISLENEYSFVFFFTILAISSMIHPFLLIKNRKTRYLYVSLWWIFLLNEVTALKDGKFVDAKQYLIFVFTAPIITGLMVKTVDPWATKLCPFYEVIVDEHGDGGESGDGGETTSSGANSP